MFTGVFCCAARQNCAQCRWPWEWPTRKDNVSFGWPSIFVVVRSHHPYLEICFLGGVQHPMCWDDEISFRCLHSKHAFFRPAETDFQTIFHPSWTKVVPQETYRQPPATCAQGGPQWKLIDQLSMVKLLDLPAWETTNLRHVPCEMQKLWRCVDVNGFFHSCWKNSSSYHHHSFVKNDMLCTGSGFVRGPIFFFKSNCQKSRCSSTVNGRSSLLSKCLCWRCGVQSPPCLWFFRWENFRTFDGYFFLKTLKRPVTGETVRLEGN